MAVLCECACGLGAIAGELPQPLHDSLRAYGHALGAIVDAEGAAAVEGQRILGLGTAAEPCHRWLCRVLEDDEFSPPTSLPSGDGSDRADLTASIEAARDAYSHLEDRDGIDAYTLELLERPIRLLEQGLELQGQPSDDRVDGSRPEDTDGTGGSDFNTDGSSAGVGDVDADDAPGADDTSAGDHAQTDTGEEHDCDEPDGTHFSSEDDR